MPNLKVDPNLLKNLNSLDQAKNKQQLPGNPKINFGDVLNEFITDVNDLQSVAKESIEKLAAGEITDVHEVMVAAEKAGVAFDLMMEIRNKMMEAYQEIMRMQV